jgi:hypothetical protein
MKLSTRLNVYQVSFKQQMNLRKILLDRDFRYNAGDVASLVLIVADWLKNTIIITTTTAIIVIVKWALLVCCQVSRSCMGILFNKEFKQLVQILSCWFVIIKLICVDYCHQIIVIFHKISG